MSELSMSDARDHFADVIDEAEGGGVVYLMRRGRRAAVVISTDELETLLTAAEDAEDRIALAIARQDPCEDDCMTLAEVKAELGLP